jgi:hypothetical protein
VGDRTLDSLFCSRVPKQVFSTTDVCRKHELQREVFSAKTKFWPKLHPGGNKTSAGSSFWPKNFNFTTHKHTKLEVFV